MKKEDKIKKKFFLEMKKLLEKHQDVWAIFQSHWDREEYREAYLVVHEALRQLKIYPDGEYRKTDEDFFWSFIR